MLLYWLVYAEYIPENKLRRLKKVQEIGYRTRERRSPTPEEIIKLCATAPIERSLIYETMAFSGLRKGEALKIKYDDLDFKQCILRVRKEASKTKKGKEYY